MGIAVMPTASKQTPLRVSFVIPAMNEATMIVSALDSIRHLELRDDISVAEVIVVDSGSTDCTPEIARAAGCHVVPAAAGNVSASRNRGSAQATGNILAFVDADCELPNTWLLHIADELNDRNVMAVGMQMAAPAADAPWVEQTWHALAHHNSESATTENTDWLATFNLAVRKGVFDTIGGFDESLITCEDVDLGYRLSNQGQLRFIPRDGVVHHEESKTLREFFRREAWRSRGGWRLLLHHRNSLRELTSCLIPFIVTGSLFAGIVGTWWNGLSLVIGVSPLLAMVIRHKPTVRILPAALVLQAVYSIARCWGMLRPAGRVERKSDNGTAEVQSVTPTNDLTRSTNDSGNTGLS
jgi:glycosyltransferase involved in cell wall biosynthesis